VPVGRRVGFEEFRQHPEIFGRMPFGLRAALSRFVFDQIEQLTSDLAAAMEGVDLVVTHPAQIAAHNVAERLGVRRVVGTVFPSMIPSAHSVPGGSPLGPWTGSLGRAANRTAWRQGSVVMGALFDRPINRHRRQLGLPPVRAGIIRLPMQAHAILVMASPAVVERPPDWPRNVEVTSFIGWDRGTRRPVTEATEAFLEAGGAPVLVTLGAANAVQGDDFFDCVTSEVAEAGARALVVTGPGTPPQRRFDPRMVHVTDFEPFGRIAGRCCGAIHHAGIGTTVAVMRAGIPHLAVPKGFDQPVNAALIERLGIGIAVPWRRRRGLLRRGIERLLRDADLRANAIDLRDRLGDDGAAATAAAVARHVTS
jgi:UDP:flavonoid glycosyltransferase YjiC (YdhE family)